MQGPLGVGTSSASSHICLTVSDKAQTAALPSSQPSRKTANLLFLSLAWTWPSLAVHSAAHKNIQVNITFITFSRSRNKLFLLYSRFSSKEEQLSSKIKHAITKPRTLLSIFLNINKSLKVGNQRSRMLIYMSLRCAARSCCLDTVMNHSYRIYSVVFTPKPLNWMHLGG